MGAEGARLELTFRASSEPGTNRSLGGILAGMWIAEISQNSVAHELGDEAAGLSDRLGGCPMIVLHDVAQVFRIERLIADHIKERQDGGALYDVNNGQALCPTCHGRKTSEARRQRFLLG